MARRSQLLRRLSIATTLASLVVGTAWAAPRRAPVPAIDIPVTRFTLDNGLTVIVHPDRRSPTVYVGMTYRIGSADEPPGRTGFAHLFEHLMFQPTSRRSGDFSIALEAAGATVVNGMTTADATSYFEVVPTNALDLALWMEADRMGNLGEGITQASLNQQRLVVLNEKRQGETQPGARGGARFFGGFYPAGHPYAHPVIGETGDIEAGSLTDVKRWFADYYGAANAVLVLSGDIDPVTAREKVTRYFGAIRRGRPVDRVAQWVPGLAADRRDVIHDQVAAPVIQRSWPVAVDDPRRSTLIQLAAKTLAGSAATPLHRDLVEGRPGAAVVASGVDASFTDQAIVGVLTVTVQLRPGISIDQGVTALDGAMARYLAVPPDRERLATVVNASDIAIRRASERSAALGTWLMRGEIGHGDPSFFIKQRDWISRATPAQVGAAAAEVLRRPFYQLDVLPMPDGRGETAGAAAALPMPVVPAASGDIRLPAISEQRLPNGLRLVSARVVGTTMVDATLSFATDGTVDGAPAPGVAGQAVAQLFAGTGHADRNGIARRMSQLGMQTSTAAGARTASLTWSQPLEHLTDATGLVADLVRHPAYPEGEIARLRTDAGATFDAQGGDPFGQGDALLRRAIWGADDRRGHIPSRSDIRALSPGALMRFHDRALTPDRATLFMVGDVTPERMLELATRSFGDWRSPPPVVVDRQAQPVSPPAGPRIILVDAPGAEQSRILVGERVAPFDRDGTAVEAMTDAVLGNGFQSRLNVELRNVRGWSYGFTGGIEDAPAGERLYLASGMVDAAHTADSLVAVRDVMRDYVTTRPMTPEELARAQSAAIAALPASLDGNAALLSTIVTADAFGLPHDRAAGTAQRIRAVTLEQAHARAARFYRPDGLTWVVVGDLSRIAADIRKLNIAPVETWNRQRDDEASSATPAAATTPMPSVPNAPNG